MARRAWWHAALASPLGLGLVVIAVLIVVIAVVRTASYSPERQAGSGVTGVPRSSPLPEGVAAPPVVLPTTNGGTFNLADYRGKTNVLIYFYEHAG